MDFIELTLKLLVSLIISFSLFGVAVYFLARVMLTKVDAQEYESRLKEFVKRLTAATK